MINELKLCRKCNESKPLSEFGMRLRPNRKTKICFQCKNCHAKQQKQWRDSHPEQHKAAVKKWHENNRPMLVQKGRRRIFRRFGLSIEQAMKILEIQENKCANPGCRVPLIWGKSRNGAALDHNHATNKMRGFLCNGCNVTLGFARDNPLVLEGLIRYLEIYDAEVFDRQTHEGISAQPERSLGHTQ